MDQATAKLVLGAYRVSREDAGDAFFAEALREVERDPELAAWFEEEQRFDRLMVSALGGASAPDGLKEMILLNAQPSGKPAALADETPPRWRRHARTGLAMAAGLLFGFVLGGQTSPRATPPAIAANRSGSNRLALQAIACTGNMPALQFVCFDASAVASWVREKAAVMKMGQLLDRPLASMQMVGSSVMQWEGKPVVMIALQNGGRMAMLYLVRAGDFPGAVAGAGEIVEKDGWVSKTGLHGEHLYVLTTKGTRKDLNFPMPL